MSKKNGTHRPEEVPEVVNALVARVAEQCRPKLSSDDKSLLPQLWQLLMPNRLPDPKHKGEGEPKLIKREPLLMICWDASQGAWKVSVGDRYFKLTVSTLSDTLCGSLVALENALVSKTALVRERD